MDYAFQSKLNYVTTNVKSVEIEYSPQTDRWFVAVNKERIQHFTKGMGYTSIRFTTKDEAIKYAVKKGLIEATKG